MIKEKLYKYVGTNGTLVTPIELLGIPSTYHYRLTADSQHHLVSKSTGKQYQTVISTEEDLINWTEEKDNNN